MNETALATSIRARLLNLSRDRKEEFQLVLTRYAMERFLYRLSQSSHRGRFILKGAMLFQIWSDTPHRPTRDLDMLAEGDSSPENIRASIEEIVNSGDSEDALEFDLSNLRVEEIREENSYGGVRARFEANLGNARIPMQIDFGIGDAITPDPIETEYPSLLDMLRPHILVYPRETVIAEKLEAIVAFGMANSRMKDYFDLWFLATTYDDDLTTLAQAVKATFARRQQSLPISLPVGLSEEFATNPDKRTQWQAFQRRIGTASPELHEVVKIVGELALKVFEINSEEKRG